MLEIERLSARYGRVQALDGLNLRLREGEAVALLGPNGAGKTTAAEAIVGLIRKHTGRVVFRGEEISDTPADGIARRGLILVPQWRELFPTFSVLETLEIAKHAAGKRQAAELSRVYDLFPILEERQSQQVSSLSGGEQQMLAIARALMASPHAIILDEPSAGLAAGIVNAMVSVVQAIRRSGTSIVLVEQNLEIARAVASHCVVLAAGRQVWAGPLHEALDTKVIRDAYFS